MDGGTNLELDRPRSATELLRFTFQLFGRYPLIFPTLAAGVVVPYLLIVLLITGDGPFEYRENLSFVAVEVLNLSSMILVWPFVSALHVHAVRDVADGNQPRLGSVARRGLISLPLVAGAVTISWIGTLAGVIALIVPGFLLWLRWSVVAQTAALDGGSPIDALRRSASLTRGEYPHVFALLVLVGLVTGVPSYLIGLPFRHSDPTIGSFLVGSAVQVLAASFGALGSAVLYFDLKARVKAESATPAPIVHALDPRSFTDANRPPGWYVVPSSPELMRYWLGDRERVWSQRTTVTPGQTLREWETLRKGGEEDQPNSIAGRAAVPASHPRDPASYSDEDRPPGWYVDPSQPKVMRYWFSDPHWVWSEHTTATPKQRLHQWELFRERGEESKPKSISDHDVASTGDPLVPDAYTDENRPPGWYIDPSRPKRMRYWAADGKPAWSRRTTKTPGKTLVEWEQLNARREEEEERGGA
jgi:hypothetical protein